MVARMVKAGTVRQALSPDLGYKRNPLDPAKWMITSQHNDRHLAAAPEKPDPTWELIAVASIHLFSLWP